MYRLYCAADLPEAYLVRALLERARIETVIFNEHAQGALGQIPFTHVYPEVWLTDLTDQARAQNILDEYHRAGETQRSRTCPACDESNPGSFDYCWSCGTQLQ